MRRIMVIFIFFCVPWVRGDRGEGQGPAPSTGRSDPATVDSGEPSRGASGEPIRDLPGEELMAFRLATQVVLSLGRLPRQRPMGDAPGLIQMLDDVGAEARNLATCSTQLSAVRSGR